MVWTVRYSEFDSYGYGIECEPFEIIADTYEDAMEKANEQISDLYDKAEYEVERKEINFEDFLQFITKHTVEEIAGGYNIECDGDMVYVDDDLSYFLSVLGAEIEDINENYAVITTTTGNRYEISSKNVKNRFDDDLPDETVLYF